MKISKLYRHTNTHTRTALLGRTAPAVQCTDEVSARQDAFEGNVIVVHFFFSFSCQVWTVVGVKITISFMHQIRNAPKTDTNA